MELLSEILGQFIGVGVIILVIVFQQELRKFLIMIGKGKLIKNKGFFKFNIGEEEKILDVETLCKACQDLSKKPVKNKALWLELDSEISKHNINWKWVKGHAGDTYNEKADFLAHRYIEEN